MCRLDSLWLLGFVIDPDEDDIQMLCNGIVEHCLITDPALVVRQEKGVG